MNKKCVIYIDESGDTGIKTDKGSSLYFIISLVLVDHDESLKIKEQLFNIINKLNIKPKEIKFSKTSFKNKILFFNNIQNIDFKSYVFIFNKLKKEKYSYYIMKSLQLINLNKDYSELLIVVDGIDVNILDNKNIKEIKRIFNIKTYIVFIDSSKNVLIQLSDMLAGLVYAVYRGKIDYDPILFKLKHKIKIIDLR